MENVILVGSLVKDRRGDFRIKPLWQPDGRLLRSIQLEQAPVDLVSGTYVSARLKSVHGVTYAYYQKTLGTADTPGVEVEIAAIRYGLFSGWPAEAEAIALKATKKQPRPGQRKDLRPLPLCTIDDETARDHDDALYCVPLKRGGWRLWVAIADVSWYVEPSDLIDRGARERGCSVYFPDAVLPMLPESLANDLCSLKPGVDRLCLVCEMVIDKRGQLADYRFYEALMNSRAQLSYTGVNQLLAETNESRLPIGSDRSSLSQTYQEMRPHLENLHALYRALKSAREERAALDVDLPSSRVIFEGGRVASIELEERGVAHRMIEECMIMANICAARRCQAHGIPCLYRVHEPPAEADHFQLASLMRRVGVKMPLDRRNPADYHGAIQQIRDRPNSKVLYLKILQAMSRALYQTDNTGHFGLALEEYTHFTSPIRRYPDLLVHRAIKYTLAEESGASPSGRKQTPSSSANGRPSSRQIHRLGVALNEAARQAEEAERFAVNWHKCLFMKRHIGQAFDATITEVREFGLFVELDSLYVQGMIHIGSLGQDYFDFEPRRMRLVGRHSRKAFALGDRLRVRLLEVDQDRQRLNLVPSIAPGREGMRQKKTFKKGKRRRRG